MYSTRIAVFCIVGLCAVQGLNANPVGDFVKDAVKKLQEKVQEIEQDFDKFKGKIGNVVGDLKEEFNNLPKCMESEKPKVKALINKAEQESMECVMKAMSMMAPVSDQMKNVTKDLVPLLRTLMEGAVRCETQSTNNIKLFICMVEVLVPLNKQIRTTVQEIQALIPVLEDIYEHQFAPLIQQCNSKVQDDVSQAKSIIAEFGKCVVNHN